MSMTRRERVFRLITFLFGWFECLVFAGCLYGWVALVFVLKQDGIYSHLCDEPSTSSSSSRQSDVDFSLNTTSSERYNTTSPDSSERYNTVNTSSSEGSLVLYKTCTRQNDKLMLAFTVGIFSLTGSTVFVGWIFDRFGTRITRIISMILFSSGSLMLGFANSDIPVLIFPGLCCFGIGGIMLLVTNMQIGNYFNVARLTVVTLYNATFDTSSSMLLMIKVLHAAGVKRLHCFITLCILNVVIVSISTFALLPKFKVFPKDRKDKRNKVLVELIPNEDDTTDGIKMGKLSEISETVKEKDSLTPVDVEMEPLPTMMTVKGLKDYLVSRVYLFELMWHAIIQLQFNYYMGTLNTMITDITNNDTYKVSFLTNVFSYILMCGIFFGPLEGLFLHLEKKRLQRDNPSYYDQLRPAALPQALCSTLCLLLSVLVLIPVEKLLYLQFISLTIFRAFLYGMNSAFLFMAFPVEHFGRLFGVLMTVNGIIGALQYPLFKWGEGPPKNYLPPSVFMIVLVSLSYLQPIAVMFGEKTDQIFKRLRCK